MTYERHSRRGLASAALLALALVAGACGAESEPDTGTRAARSTVLPSVTAEVIAQPTPATPDASPLPSATRPAQASGIEGYVSIGPTCPVEREDSPCPDAPFAADLIVRREDGALVATVRSGADGIFRLAVPPGRYVIEPRPPSPGTPPQAAEVAVAVQPGQITHVEISYDSGIR